MTHPHQTANTAGATGNRVDLLIVCLCFMLSGVAALIYQTAWTRQFSLVFGTSELAVAAVLAAYMGGLALGAWLIEKCIRQVRRPVLWYANLELGIALAALILIPAGLWLTEQLMVMSFGGQAAPPSATLGGTSLFYLMAAFVVLLVPTTLMGATLPLLARHAVHSEAEIGTRIGLLYTCNTAGAVGGALMGALFLLPRFGLSKTVWVAAGINVLVAVLALTLSRTSINRALAAQGVGDNTINPLPEGMRAGTSPAWVLPLMLVSGAVSFLHEVLWTRMLGHVLGSSLYAFGVMVASFLAGIALGGGLGAMLARNRATAARWLAISELAAALAAVGAWQTMQRIGPDLASLPQRVSFGFVLLFPLALTIGMTYPLAVRVLARGVVDAAQASARVYSWNTVGAIVGAIAGGFLIVPALRYEGSVQLAVIASCLLACIACLVLFKPGKQFGIPVTVTALATVILFAPKPPEALLRYSSLQVSGEGELLYYDVGRSAAVVTLRQGDQLAVRTNGLPEATIDTRGMTPQLYVEAWMAPLAVLARPPLQDMLIVGFGGGRVIEAVPPSVRSIDVIELEDKVIAANRNVAERRLRDPLRDSRVNLISNDARGALQLTAKKYDAVISQPSHPWTAGASHLYTREFMQQAKDHLNPGGLFVQWMNVDFLDESLLRSLLATINDVYPYVRVYRPAPPTLLFLASDQAINPEQQITATRAAFAAAPAHYAGLGLNTVEDLVAALALDNEGSRAFAGDAAVITDDANRFATASVYDFGRNISAEHVGRLLAPYDPLLKPGSFVYRELSQQLAFDYVARRIQAFVPVDESARTRIKQLAEQFPNSDLRPYIGSLALNNALHSSEAQQAQSDEAKAYPNSALLRDVLLESQLAALNFHGGFNADPLADQAIASDQAIAINQVVRAAQFAAHNDWRSVAGLDAALAQTPWTSLWNNLAVRLRVEWRVHLRDDASNPRFDADSIAMIDHLNAFQPDPRLYFLRAMSAGNEPNFLIESLFKYTQSLLQGQVTADAFTRREFGNLQQRFEQLRHDHRIDQHRYREVQSTVEAAAAMLK